MAADAAGAPQADCGSTCGDRCAPHEIDVIPVAGPHVSPGYHNPVRDAGVFLCGVLNTDGDLGYTDEEGRLYIAGRAKDLIIRIGPTSTR